MPSANYVYADPDADMIRAAVTEAAIVQATTQSAQQGIEADGTVAAIASLMKTPQNASIIG